MVAKHAWDYLTSSDPARYTKGEKQMQEIRNVISWIQGKNLNIKTELLHLWKKYPSKEFRSEFPKNLKKGNRTIMGKGYIKN